MRTTADVRAAYQHLADLAPTVDQLQFDAATLAPRHRTLVSVAAVAVAALVAAVLVVLLRGGTDHRGSQPATTNQVVCTATNRSADAARDDIPVVQSRLTILGLRGAVRSTANGSALTITPNGHTSLDSIALCTNATLEAKAVTATTKGSCVPPTTSPTQVCGPGGAQLIFGQTIFTERDIVSAVATMPNAAAGTFEWTVAITLSSAGQHAWSAWTTAHNARGADTSQLTLANCGTKVPCQDFVAFVINGRVAYVPLTLAPILGTTTELNANLTQKSATQLAATLNRLPIPLQVGVR
jgi:hypothetical protein